MGNAHEMTGAEAAVLEAYNREQDRLERQNIAAKIDAAFSKELAEEVEIYWSYERAFEEALKQNPSKSHESLCKLVSAQVSNKFKIPASAIEATYERLTFVRLEAVKVKLGQPK